MPARWTKGNDKKVQNVCRLYNSRKTNKHVTVCFVISERKHDAFHTRESVWKTKAAARGKKVGRRSEKSFVAPAETGGSLDYLREDFENRMFFFCCFFCHIRHGVDGARTAETVSRFCLNKSRLWCKRFRLYCLIALWVMQVPARKIHWIKMMHLLHPS